MSLLNSFSYKFPSSNSMKIPRVAAGFINAETDRKTEKHVDAIRNSCLFRHA